MPYEIKNQITNVNVRRGPGEAVYGDVVPGVAVTKGEALAVLTAAFDAELTGDKGYEGLLVPASVIDTTNVAAAKTSFITNFVGVAAFDMPATERNRKMTVYSDAYVEMLTAETGLLPVGTFLMLADSSAKFNPFAWKKVATINLAIAVVVEQAPLHYPFNDLVAGTYATPPVLGAPVKVEGKLIPGWVNRTQPA